jgi:secretion/DNA translocation related TadE-like protein
VIRIRAGSGRGRPVRRPTTMWPRWPVRPHSGGSGKPRLRGDAGVATVWAAAGIAVIIGVLVFGLQLAAAITARHRASAAADLAALAAAGHAVWGAQVACGRAGQVATAMSATVAACELDGWEARVEVRAELSFSLLIDDAAVGRARAGPVPVTDLTDPGGGERSDEPDGRTADPRRPDDPGNGPSTERFGAPAARSSLHVHRSATTAGSAMNQSAY